MAACYQTISFGFACWLLHYIIWQISFFEQISVRSCGITVFRFFFGAIGRFNPRSVARSRSQRLIMVLKSGDSGAAPLVRYIPMFPSSEVVVKVVALFWPGMTHPIKASQSTVLARKVVGDPMVLNSEVSMPYSRGAVGAGNWTSALN